MRVLILGASGGCGRWATRIAVNAGHQVTALVRPQTPFQPVTGVIVHRGWVLDASVLARACEGQDAIISCIGLQRTQPWNPWAPLRPPGQVTETVAGLLATVLPSISNARFAAISAAGVGESWAVTNWPMRWLIRHSTIGAMYADLNRMEDVLRQSTLDWVAVRPLH